MERWSMLCGSRCALLAIVLAGCRSSCGEAKPGAERPKAIEVPETHGDLHLDGELEEADWRVAARTGPFLDNAGGPARPYSEAKILADRDHLYLGLYAADEDIEARPFPHDGPLWLDDAFSIRLQPEGGPAYRIDIAPTGTVTDAVETSTGGIDLRFESGIRVGVDMDGTLNNPEDDDEEWVLETALPRAFLKGARRLNLRLSRADTPKKSQRRTGVWSGTIQLPP
jgi:hypothetical protein